MLLLGALAGAILALSFADETSGEDIRVLECREIARLTGEGAINDTAAVCVGGTDLGILVEHGDRIWAFFGDTFRGPTPRDGGLWRHNTLCWIDDDEPEDGLSLDGWVMDANGCARQAIEDEAEGQVTLIPTGALSTGEWMYVWCMSVKRWGEPGQWDLNHSRLFRSKDGTTFSRVPGVEWGGNSRFGMVAVAPGAWADGADKYVYMLGTPGGRLGGVSAARVAIDRVDDQMAYEYFTGADATGAAVWSDDESDCETIINPTVGELSLFYIPDAERWGLLYFDHDAAAIELRHARQPWGVWSDPVTVATAEQYPMLYGSYTCPRYITDGGRRIYFTMSLWEPYDVYWMRLDLGFPHISDQDRGAP